MVPAGTLILILATILVFWAQKTSRSLDTKNMSKETFCKGPYCYTRSPTHWGLFFLMLGFGIIANAVFVVLFTLIAFLLVRFIFLEKEERILTEKYGAPYLEYKESVRL
jgi:protein-S-isoprenylcysteine O-methyltransferase Ste14